ncbi:MAG: hypothetical protein AMJ65_09730 [Phycisphaerae bacterium SG8_4]|nr:MAG: hypothetical protein AMJ65_09730 [Phycisphaerae bacterium SG8_4]
MRIMLDPGHGGNDPGAISESNIHEADVNLDVALQMAGHLASNLSHLCRLTRYDDTFIALGERCRIANDWGADVFVSIHCNSFTDPAAEGFEVYTNRELDAADFLASVMWNGFRQAFPLMRGRVDLSDGDPDKEAGFVVLVGTRMPAVLFELGFLSNKMDEARIASFEWRAKAAKVLVDAIREWSLLQ